MSKSSRPDLELQVSECERLAALMVRLAEQMPPRATVRQTAAFALAASVIAKGHTITQSELVALGADDPHTGPVFGSAPERVLASFMKPTKRDPDALNWLSAEEDEDDRRRKLLNLTRAGRSALAELLSILNDTV